MGQCPVFCEKIWLVYAEKMTEKPPEKWIVGGKQNEDGSWDNSKALNYQPTESEQQAFEESVEKEKHEKKTDTEFMSGVSRWFGKNKEWNQEKMRDNPDDLEEENWGHYLNQAERSVTELGQPGRVDRRVQKDGTAEKYGLKNARSMYVAEGMAALGVGAAWWHDKKGNLTAEDLKDTDLSNDVKLLKDAKETFLKAGDKVFTPSGIDDPLQELESIIDTYDSLQRNADHLFADGDKSKFIFFEGILESIKSGDQLEGAIDAAISECFRFLFREKLREAAQRTFDNEVEDFTPTESEQYKYQLAAANKIMWRLMKVEEKIASK